MIKIGVLTVILVDARTSRGGGGGEHINNATRVYEALIRSANLFKMHSTTMSSGVSNIMVLLSDILYFDKHKKVMTTLLDYEFFL